MSEGTGHDWKEYWEARTHQKWMDGLNSSHLFHNNTDGGTTGWAFNFPRVRRDLFLMLDNGWQNGSEASSREIVLDTKKFPEFKDPDPTKSLKMLQERVVAEGWRGLGVWVNGERSVSTKGFQRLHEAGVGLLKFDGGDSGCKMTQLAKEYAPGLIVEHGACVSSCPMNGWPGTGRVSSKDYENQAHVMGCGDAFRSYDTVRVFAVAETLDRQAQLLTAGSSINSSTLRHFGGSGEPSVTAALGGTIQPMRSNIRGQSIPPQYMVYASGPRQRQQREDEITRFVNWAKVAPPFGGGLQRSAGATALDVKTLVPDQVKMSELILWDTWHFAEADDAAAISHKLTNTTVLQGAPAIVTRGGLELPSVAALPPSQCAGGSTNLTFNYCQPFVIATRFPNDVISVSTIGRTRPDFGADATSAATSNSHHLHNVHAQNMQPKPLPGKGSFVEAMANVTLKVGRQLPTTRSASTAAITVGIFGYYDTLRLVFDGSSAAVMDAPMTTAVVVLAQDLTGASAVQDISKQIHWEQQASTTAAMTLVVSGGLIEEVGLAGRSRSDDVSSPGLVLRIVPAASR
jgi:hypothetical protein